MEEICRAACPAPRLGEKAETERAAKRARADRDNVFILQIVKKDRWEMGEQQILDRATAIGK